jgi:metal transporter CNNM
VSLIASVKNHVHLVLQSNRLIARIRNSIYGDNPFPLTLGATDTVLINSLVVFVLVVLSAICSGLNVALMSLSVTDLRRKRKLGNAAAKKVLPLRKNSNLSLASILLANVAVISATSLVLNHALGGSKHAVNGIIAGIVSTLLIVLFGEIFPQAIFSRHALQFTARFAPLLKVIIYITYPLSKPLQLLLDKLLGKELYPIQSRHELGILLGEHLKNEQSELDEDEVEIMQGALTLSEKRVRDIMTKIRNVYWLTPETIINADVIDEIKLKGFSRIPIFDTNLTRSNGVLLMKDLVDIDFDEIPQKLQDLPLYSSQIVGSMTALDTLFRKFIVSGTHLLPVERDDHIVGIVTIEDLLEEIVGHEIEDETDRLKQR